MEMMLRRDPITGLFEMVPVPEPEVEKEIVENSVVSVVQSKKSRAPTKR